MATREGKNTSANRKSAAQRKSPAKQKAPAKQKSAGESKRAAKRGEAAKENPTGNQENATMTTQEDPLLRERKRTYEGFIKLCAYSVAGTVAVLILLALFLL